MSAKKKEIETLESDIQDQFKKELDHGDIKDVDKFISTGSTLLDYAISNRVNGGIPQGRIIEICGNESSGKSLLGYHILVNAQKMGGIGVYIDTERAASRSFMERIGVNFDALVTPKKIPSSIEEVFDYIEKVVKVTKEKFPNKDKPVVIVWDSVAATGPKEEAELTNEEDGRMGSAARAMSKCLRRVMEVLDEGYVTIVCINQLRAKIALSFGDPDITPHGKSLPFYSSVRIKMTKLKQIKDIKADRTVGVMGEGKVFKNKVAPGWRTANFPVMYDSGIDDDTSLLHYLENIEVVTGAAVKTITDHKGKEYQFRIADWSNLLQTEKDLKEFVDNTVKERMIITFETKPNLQIDTDSILEVQQIKDDLEEKE
jgi:recombination protein RecA